MIETIIIYTVRCDKCRALHTKDGRHINHNFHVKHSIDEAKEDFWVESDGNQHYCPNCHNQKNTQNEQLNSIFGFMKKLNSLRSK